MTLFSNNQMRKRKKIAFVANSTWNIYNFRLVLLKAFIKQGFEVVVIAPIDEYITYLNYTSGIRHIPIQRLSRKSTNPIKDIFLFRELRRIYKKENPDLIIHYTIKPNIFGNLAAKVCMIPSVCVVTGLGYSFLKDGWIKKITIALYRFSFKYSNKVVFENKDDTQLFIDSKIAAAEKCIAVKGCGVNLNRFRPLPKQKYKDSIVFTFIGRLLYDKGIVEFVEAAKILKEKFSNVAFHVVGDIDVENPSFIPKTHLLNWIDDKIIRYFGVTEDIRRFIKNSDCIVLPSYREGMPRVVLEGMAMGRPIITTDTPGCRETVEVGVNGYLTPIKNVKDLAARMEEFYHLNEYRKLAMGEKSYKRAVNEFDEKYIVKDYINIVNSILNSTPFDILKKNLSMNLNYIESE